MGAETAREKKQREQGAYGIPARYQSSAMKPAPLIADNLLTGLRTLSDEAPS
jgi:hypothetical protein